MLGLEETQVTDAGVRELKRALPKTIMVLPGFVWVKNTEQMILSHCGSPGISGFF